MVMEAVGSAASAVGEALGLLKPDKAKIVCVGDNKPAGKGEIECMFNPTEYRLTQTLNVTRNQTPAKDGGTPEFSGTNAMTLTTQLFFDDFGSMKGDVTPKITTLLSWTHPTAASLDKKKPCPPLVSFRWGGNPQLDGFSGFLKSVVVNYTIFSKDGTPLQAKVDITIEGQPEAIGGQNPTSHSINSRRVHTMIDGRHAPVRRLPRAGQARLLARDRRAQRHRRPATRARPGTVLLIPSLADAAKGS